MGGRSSKASKKKKGDPASTTEASATGSSSLEPSLLPQDPSPSGADPEHHHHHRHHHRDHHHPDKPHRTSSGGEEKRRISSGEKRKSSSGGEASAAMTTTTTPPEEKRKSTGEKRKSTGEKRKSSGPRPSSPPAPRAHSQSPPPPHTTSTSNQRLSKTASDGTLTAGQGEAPKGSTGSTAKPLEKRKSSSGARVTVPKETPLLPKYTKRCMVFLFHNGVAHDPGVKLATRPSMSVDEWKRDVAAGKVKGGQIARLFRPTGEEVTSFEQMEDGGRFVFTTNDAEKLDLKLLPKSALVTE